MTQAAVTSDGELDPLAEECKIALVLDVRLERGATDNRAAVLATGLAARHPEIIGQNLLTSDGQEILGFTKVPIAVLAARAETSVRDLASRARELGCTALVFLGRAQGLRSYDAYRESVAQSAADELDVDSCILFGPKKAVNKVVGSLPAFR